MSIFEKIITTAIKENKVITITLKKLVWDQIFIGYVENYDSQKGFVLKEINQYGKYLKDRKVLYSDLTSVQINNIYCNTLETCYKDDSWKRCNSTKYINTFDFPSIQSHFEKLIVHKEICTFFYDTQYMYGILIGHTTDQILVKNINSLGYEDGYSSTQIKTLTKIRYKGSRETKIRFLYNHPQRVTYSTTNLEIDL